MKFFFRTVTARRLHRPEGAWAASISAGRPLAKLLDVFSRCCGFAESRTRMCVPEYCMTVCAQIPNKTTYNCTGLTCGHCGGSFFPRPSPIQPFNSLFCSVHLSWDARLCNAVPVPVKAKRFFQHLVQFVVFLQDSSSSADCVGLCSQDMSQQRHEASRVRFPNGRNEVS